MNRKRGWTTFYTFIHVYEVDQLRKQNPLRIKKNHAILSTFSFSPIYSPENQMGVSLSLFIILSLLPKFFSTCFGLDGFWMVSPSNLHDSYKVKEKFVNYILWSTLFKFQKYCGFKNPMEGQRYLQGWYLFYPPHNF